MQLVDVAGLASLAELAGVVVEVAVPPGQFATRGVRLCDVLGSARPSAEFEAKLDACFDIGPIRTMQDDAEWGVRQIVDIALKAISPAVNDPSTAVTCIDHLGRVLVRAMTRHARPSHVGGPDGRTARVILQRPDHARLLDLAVLQIRQYAKADMAVSLRLLRLLETVAQTEPAPNVIAQVTFHAVAIERAARASFEGGDCEELNHRLERLRGLCVANPSSEATTG